MHNVYLTTFITYSSNSHYAPEASWALLFPSTSTNRVPTLLSLTSSSNPSENPSTGVNYEPDPSTSLKVSSEREEIVRKITKLYSGSASEEEMLVFAKEAVYDDPWSFCDTRYKLGGQWYGMHPSVTPSVCTQNRTCGENQAKQIR